MKKLKAGIVRRALRNCDGFAMLSDPPGNSLPYT